VDENEHLSWLSGRLFGIAGRDGLDDEDQDALREAGFLLGLARVEDGDER
jgi:hypothetical protein